MFTDKNGAKFGNNNKYFCCKIKYLEIKEYTSK